jgi:putative oxidoreductase
MNAESANFSWRTPAILVARLIFAGIFIMAATFKFLGMEAAAYVLFLGFAFHGPSHWATNQAEFGFFVDHFTFIAGLLFAAVHGPGRVLAANIGYLGTR